MSWAEGRETTSIRLRSSFEQVMCHRVLQHWEGDYMNEVESTTHGYITELWDI
jgi:hypothetical protein